MVRFARQAELLDEHPVTERIDLLAFPGRIDDSNLCAHSGIRRCDGRVALTLLALRGRARHADLTPCSAGAAVKNRTCRPCVLHTRRAGSGQIDRFRIERRLGVAQSEPLQRCHHRLCDEQVAVPALLRRDDIPGGGFGGAA